MDGLLIVDKKEGMTSFDVVRNIRKEYNEKKVGHIGTLDPMASGVLPILIGKATKLSDYLMEHDKEYIAKIKLGIKTDTADREGKIIEQKPVIKENITIEKVQNVLNQFLGETEQIPPMYSAIKVNGKKLYEMARENKSVERKPRKIKITKIELLNINIDENEITYKVECSKGTYIRTLSEDIAKKLETVGYMSYLRRTRVGNFKIEEAGKLIEIENIIEDIQEVQIKEEKLKAFLNGVKIHIAKDEYNTFKNETNGERNNSNKNENALDKKLLIEKTNQMCKVYCNNQFIGFGEIVNNQLKRKVII